MGVAAAVGTIGSAVVGGVAQSSAASKAAKAQTNAANQSIAEQNHFFDVTQQNLEPYIQTGSAASQEISGLEGLNGGNSSTIQATLQSMPGYQFANQQGLKSTQNAAAARGLGVSGAALKGAASYSTGLANEYYNNLLSGLQQTQNTGAQAAESLGGDATTTGNNIGNTTYAAGKSQAASDISQGAAISTAANSLPSGLVTGQLLQNQQNQAQQGIYDSTGNSFYNSGTFDQGAFSNGLPWSDARLKEKIIFLRYENDLPVYEFNYIWSPKRFIGVMAQDVIKLVPEAVHKFGEFFAVDYSLLGVEFRAA